MSDIGLYQIGDSPNIGSNGRQSNRHYPEYSKGDALTERELEVFALVAEGYSSKEITKKLWIGVETIKDHRKSILRKLGAKNAVNAVAIGIRAGII